MAHQVGDCLVELVFRTQGNFHILIFFQVVVVEPLHRFQYMGVQWAVVNDAEGVRSLPLVFLAARSGT